MKAGTVSTIPSLCGICNTVIAVPYDMYVSGLGDGVARLRLWAARKPALDMSLFNQGEYIKAMEQYCHGRDHQ